jgi:hypothetical protein
MSIVLALATIVGVAWFSANVIMESNRLAMLDMLFADGAPTNELDGSSCPLRDPCTPPARCIEYATCFGAPRAQCFKLCGTDEDCGDDEFCNGGSRRQIPGPESACLRRSD